MSRRGDVQGSRAAIRPAIGLVVLSGLLACGTKTITAPPPPMATTPHVAFSAPSPVALDGNQCMPTVTVAVAGPVGTRLTWTGMGVRIGSTGPDAYDRNFDLAVTQRFWAGEGLDAGEVTSAGNMLFGGFGSAPITMRFFYTLSNSPEVRRDSVTVVCR